MRPALRGAACLVAAGVLLRPAWAGEPPEGRVCQQIAAHVRSDVRPAALRAGGALPQALAAGGHGFLRLDARRLQPPLPPPDDPHRSPGQRWAAFLQDTYGVPPALLEGIAAMDFRTEALRLPHGDVWVFVQTVGAQHCQSLIGLSNPVAGTASAVPLPLGAEEDGCFTAALVPAEVAGEPVLLADLDVGATAVPDHADLQVAALHGPPPDPPAFDPPCVVSVRFRLHWQAEDWRCTGAACGGLRRLVAALAARLDAGGATPFSGDEAVADPALLAAVDAADRAGTLPERPFATMRLRAPALSPVMLPGRIPVIARWGHPEFRARDYPGFTVEFYGRLHGRLAALGGAQLVPERAGILEVLPAWDRGRGR